MEAKTYIVIFFHIIHLHLKLVLITPVVISLTHGYILAACPWKIIDTAWICHSFRVHIFLMEKRFYNIRIFFFIFSYNIRSIICGCIIIYQNLYIKISFLCQEGIYCLFYIFTMIIGNTTYTYFHIFTFFLYIHQAKLL